MKPHLRRLRGQIFEVNVHLTLDERESVIESDIEFSSLSVKISSIYIKFKRQREAKSVPNKNT